MSVFKRSLKGLSAAIAVGFLSACMQLGATEEGIKNGEAKEPVALNEEFVQCSTPRPEICYELYQPVCATRDNGVRCVTTPCPATEIATYSNDCKACADPTVLGFVKGGACKGSELSVDLLQEVGAS